MTISQIEKGEHIKDVRVSVGRNTETDGSIYKVGNDYYIVIDSTWLTPKNKRKLDYDDCLRYELI